MNELAALIIALIGIIGVAGGAAFFFVHFMKRRARFARALNMKLLLVRLPLAEAKDEAVQLDRMRERISVMEQFYSSIAGIKSGGWFSVKPWFAFEMTVPAKTTELSFYVAAPRAAAETLEKLIHAYYPDASVDHAPDYNIFTAEGETVIARGRAREEKFLPFRTYRSLDADPLKAFASVFTKLDEESEGAAFQLVIRPASSHWRTQLLARAQRVYRNKNEAKSHTKILSEVISGKKESDEKEKEAKAMTPIDEAAARLLMEKAAKTLFEVNIRLVASAPSKERAAVILQSLEQAFLPLNDPNSNAIEFAREKPRKVRRRVLDFSFRLFDEKETLVLSAEELTSMYHFPNAPIEVPGIQSVSAKDSAPPSDLPKEGLLLGFNSFRGVDTPIKFTQEDRRRHFYIIGQTGTGKSAFLKNLIRQDIENGQGLCVIDPHGELTEYALGFVPEHRVDDVIYFDPGDVARPMGLNMMEYDLRFPEHKTLLVNELLAIFEKLFNMSIAGGPQFEQYFRNAALLVMDDPESGNTLLEIRRVFSDKAYRDMKIAKSENILVKSFWTQIAEKAGGEQSLANMVPYVTSKFDGFLSNDIMRPIVAQQHSSFNFRDVMDQRKILLINLSKGKLGELNSSLLGLILVGKLLLASFSRTDIDERERKDFFLYIDEFQNVTTKSIATILSEARKYRLSMTMTHQFIGQLDEDIKKAVFGNVGSLMAFRIGSEDGEFMEKQFLPEFSARDLLSLDNYRAYVKLLVAGKTSRPFSMRTYAPQEANRARAEYLKDRSSERYGRPRAEVEAEIAARHH